MSGSDTTGQSEAADRSGLPDDVRTFIVQALACFDTPSEVAKAVKDGFGRAMSRQAVEAYDPTKRAGAGLSAEHRAVFDATRATFLKETAAIGVMHRAVRMRRLQRMVERAESMGNIALEAKLLEQAAKEMGGAFTNRFAVGGDTDKEPVQMIVTWKPAREQGG